MLIFSWIYILLKATRDQHERLIYDVAYFFASFSKSHPFHQDDSFRLWRMTIMEKTTLSIWWNITRPGCAECCRWCRGFVFRCQEIEDIFFSPIFSFVRKTKIKLVALYFETKVKAEDESVEVVMIEWRFSPDCCCYCRWFFLWHWQIVQNSTREFCNHCNELLRYTIFEA